MSPLERTEPHAPPHPGAVSVLGTGAPAETAGAPSVPCADAHERTGDAGPFIVYSREFTSARPPVFETWAEAFVYAKHLANSTPGFAYYIMVPAAIAMCATPGCEAKAMRACEGVGGA